MQGIETPFSVAIPPKCSCGLLAINHSCEVKGSSASPSVHTLQKQLCQFEESFEERNEEDLGSGVDDGGWSFKNEVSPDDWIPKKLEQYRKCGKEARLILRQCGHRCVGLLRCHSPLCLLCMRLDMEEMLGRYMGVLEQFSKPVFLTLPVKSSHSPEESLDVLYKGFEKLKDMRISNRGLLKWEKWVVEEIGRYWSLELWKLIGLGLWHWFYLLSLWKRIQRQWRFWKKFRNRCRKFLKQGIKNLRLYHLLVGVFKLEITYSAKEGFHPHLHGVLDDFRVPQLLISRLWYEVTGARVVDIRSAYSGYHRELIKYTSKPWELEGLLDELKGKLLWSLRGRKKVLVCGLKVIDSKKDRCPDCKKKKDECQVLRVIPVRFEKGLTYGMYMKLRAKRKGQEENKSLKAIFEMEGFREEFGVFWDREKGQLSWIDFDEELKKEGYSTYDEDSFLSDTS